MLPLSPPFYVWHRSRIFCIPTWCASSLFQPCTSLDHLTVDRHWRRDNHLARLCLLVEWQREARSPYPWCFPPRFYLYVQSYSCASHGNHNFFAATSMMLTYCATRLGADIELGTYQHPAFCRNIQTASYSMTLTTTAVATALIAYKSWWVFIWHLHGSVS